MSVREAAERLRDVLNGNLIEDVYGHLGNAFSIDRDKEELAYAYLADHPADDDEPITDAWLRELSDTPSSHVFAVCFRGIHGVALSVMRYRDGFAVYAESTLIQYVKTRRQLRNLLDALGVETKGGA